MMILKTAPEKFPPRPQKKTKHKDHMFPTAEPSILEAMKATALVFRGETISKVKVESPEKTVKLKYIWQWLRLRLECVQNHVYQFFEVNHPFSVGTSLKIRDLFGKIVFQDVFLYGHPHFQNLLSPLSLSLHVAYLD